MNRFHSMLVATAVTSTTRRARRTART